MPQSLIIEQFNPQEIPQLAKWVDDGNLCASKLFAFIADKPWSMLLHSGNCDHPNSRFDIMVANPIAHISCYQAHCDIVTPQSEDTVAMRIKDPLVWIKDALAKYLPDISVDHHLPFYGGAMGYFGYDLGGQYERLPQNAVDDMHTPQLKVAIYDWAIIKDNHHHQWWFVSHRLSLHQVLQSFFVDEVQTFEPFLLTTPWQSNMSKAQYQQRYQQVQAYLHSGDCYQINLAQRFCANFAGNPYEAFETLVAVNQAPFSAYLHFADFTVISVSPERLLKLSQGAIESKPIKGTIKRSTDPQVDMDNQQQLHNSIKDRAENVMIVDLLRNDIGKVSIPGSVNVPYLFAIESFPAVHHLVSTVTGQLSANLHASDLLRAAFPGGSITGAPKVRAMEIIDQLEPHRRSVYCGSVGYICCTGNMDTSITIRTLLAKDKHIYCWAGGGIVADSDCDSEYQETYAKVSKILPVLSDLPSDLNK